MMKSLKMMCTMYNSVIVIRRIVFIVKTLVLFIIVIFSRNSSVYTNIYIFMYHICKYMKINVLLPKSILYSMYFIHVRNMFIVDSELHVRHIFHNCCTYNENCTQFLSSLHFPCL